MSSRHDYRRRDRSWERDDRDKGRDRDRDRDRDRYSRRRSSRSRSPRRSGMYYQSTLSYNLSTVLLLQIDVTMEEIGMRTGETGIPGTHAAAMSEIDETHLGGMEKRTGIGMRGTRGMDRRVGMQSTTQRGLLWIQSPGRQ